jgi:hypothetical protein
VESRSDDFISVVGQHHLQGFFDVDFVQGRDFVVGEQFENVLSSAINPCLIFRLDDCHRVRGNVHCSCHLDIA